MLVAAGIFQQQRIADVVKRRTVLPGGKRAERGAGKILKPHAATFLTPAPSRWKNYTVSRQIPDVTDITEGPSKMPFTVPQQCGRPINFRYRNNSLKGNRRSTLPPRIGRAKGFLGAVPQIERNSRAPSRPTPQTEISLARLTVRAPLPMTRNERV